MAGGEAQADGAGPGAGEEVERQDVGVGEEDTAGVPAEAVPQDGGHRRAPDRAQRARLHRRLEPSPGGVLLHPQPMASLDRRSCQRNLETLPLLFYTVLVHIFSLEIYLFVFYINMQKKDFFSFSPLSLSLSLSLSL